MNENIFVTGEGYERFTIMKNIVWISNGLKISVLAAFSVLVSASSIWAQSSGPRILIGPIGGYNNVAYNTDVFPILNSEPSYYEVENGTGHGFFFGLSCNLPLDTGLHNFFVLEALYDSKPGDFTNLNGSRVGSDSSYFLSASLSYLLINVGYKFNFWSGAMPKGLGVQLCLSVGIKTSSIFDKTITTTGASPTSYVYPSSITSASVLRLALRPELSYDIPFATRWLLTPSIGYDAPLTKVDAAENWRANSLYGAIALRYAIGSF
jgi:hypothetical protein